MGTDPKVDSRDYHIIFFDGVCNLCNGFVDFILKRDKEGKFRFASLQSEEAEEYLGNHDVITGDDPDSVVLLTPGEEVYTESNAVLRIAGILGGAWPLLKVFYVFPTGFRDSIYRWVARNRYKWFGKKETCRLPTQEEQARFL